MTVYIIQCPNGEEYATNNLAEAKHIARFERDDLKDSVIIYEYDLCDLTPISKTTLNYIEKGNY